jgi:hypothetical protein
MSDLSDLILPSGLVLGGLYLIKRYTEQTGQNDFDPISKDCIGPICWTKYGPPVTRTPGLGGGGGNGSGTVNPPTSDWRDPFCNWPGSNIIFPPCFGYTYRGYA